MSAQYARPIPVSKAAPHPAEPNERVCTIKLTPEEVRTVAAALLAQSVLCFNACDRQEAVSRMDEASSLWRDGYLLARVEILVRNAKAGATE